MEKSHLVKGLLFAMAVSGLLFTACNKEPFESFPAGENDEPGLELKGGNGASAYIVVLNNDFAAAADLTGKKDYDQRSKIMKGHLNRFLNGKGVGNDQVEQVYTNVLMGFSAKLSRPQYEKLSQDPAVKSIEPDEVVVLRKPTSPSPPPAASQVTPWGITRVGCGATYTGSNRAWIIDTGVDLTHPDLNVLTTDSKTFVTKTKNANDDNGHGTHVAGIIAARNNSIGVVGVAAGAPVTPVKVLNKSGSGYYSWIIAGVDWVASRGKSGDVANLSLGGSAYQALDDAVIALGNKGIRVALAAGNEADDANSHSPARANGTNVYTVSAMDSGDKFAYFSNFGNPPIDYCGPGVSIYSCYKGGTYVTMSGTSMAAPHVAGLLLWGTVNASGYVTGDPDGNPDPIAHK